MIPLIWNSMMSWAGGWFFLMAAEQFTLGAHSFQLPGLGSYLQTAANAGDDRRAGAGPGDAHRHHHLLDQLLWRPLIAWADRFKLEQTTAGRAPTSAVLRALRRSELLDWLGTTVARPTNEALDRGIARLLAPRAASAPAPKTMPVAVAVPVAAKDPAPGSASGLAPLGGPLAKPAEQQLAPPRPSGMPHPPGMPRLPGRATTARARDIARRSAALAARLRARWSSGRWSPGRVAGALALAVLVVGGVWGSLAALRLLAQLSLADWGLVAVSAGATLLRTLAALAVGVAWTVPAGVAIGLNPRAARIAQPLAQMVASIPATALFPVLLLVLVGLPGGLNLAAVALMLLGTQWYVLFNVIAGAMAIPTRSARSGGDLQAARLAPLAVPDPASDLPRVGDGHDHRDRRRVEREHGGGVRHVREPHAQHGRAGRADRGRGQHGPLRAAAGGDADDGRHRGGGQSPGLAPALPAGGAAIPAGLEERFTRRRKESQ